MILERETSLLAIFLVGLFWVGRVHAEGPGWTGAVSVVEIVNVGSGGVNVKVSPGLVNCVSQSGYGRTYASIYPNNPGINRIKADLLMASATGKKMSFYLSNSKCDVAETILHLE